MYHIAQICPVCKAGYIGFMKSLGEKPVLMFCDECDATWIDPSDITLHNSLLPDADNIVQEYHSKLERPATKEEIDACAWGSLIAGDYNRPSTH